MKTRLQGLILCVAGMGAVFLILTFPFLVIAQSGSPLENFIRRTLPSPPSDPERREEPSPRESDRESEQPPLFSYPPLIIDPGHGGADRGGQGETGLPEKEVTFRLAQHIARQMADTLPFTPLLTREADDFLTAEGRASFANNHQGALFISIHTGGTVAVSSPVHRVYVYGGKGERGRIGDTTPLLVRWDQMQHHYHQASLQLGKSVRAALQQALGEEVQLRTDVPLLLLESLQMPAILIEIGQLAPAEREKRLTDPLYQNQVAQGIIEGIRGYTASRF